MTTTAPDTSRFGPDGAVGRCADALDAPLAGRPGAPLRILAIEDEGDIRTLLGAVLSQEGFDYEAVGDGAAAFAAIAQRPPDLILLDLNLPGMDGADVLEEIRRGSGVPVIVLSARQGVGDRVLGLDLGADDYVVKPFSARELRARVNSVLRRARPAAPERIVHGALVIEVSSREVTVAGAPVELTRREFDLLSHLAGIPRRVVSREALLRDVWHSSADWQDPDTVTEHVRRLRVKLDAAGDLPNRLETVRGVGYRFQP